MPLCFIPTPIGNLDDITIRALKKIESAQIVFCEDTRITKKLFALLAMRHNITPATEKYISMHSHNEEYKLQNIDLELFKLNCIFVSDAGMPCISDPGAKLVQFCLQNSVHYEILPGASAVLTAFSASGITSSEFYFGGFLPHKLQAKTELLSKYLQKSEPTIIFEAPHRLLETLEILSKLDPDRYIFTAKELTKMHETYTLLSAKNLFQALQAKKILGEWVIVIYPNENATIAQDSIFKPDMDKKSLAKAIAKITGQDVKSIYMALTANLR